MERRPGPDLGAAGLWSRLDRWIAEGNVGAAATARARRRWLREQAAATTTFAAILVDLADRGRPVLVETTAGHRHRGPIRALGADVVALTVDHDALVLVPTRAVTSVRADPGPPSVGTAAMPDVDLTLEDVLLWLAEDRPRVTITTGPAAHIVGTLTSVGADVATVRLEDERRTTLYVPLHAIEEVTRRAR